MGVVVGGALFVVVEGWKVAIGLGLAARLTANTRLITTAATIGEVISMLLIRSF